MSEGLEPQPGAFSAAQTGTPTEAAAGARLDAQGAVPTDFTGRVPGSQEQKKMGLRENLLSRGRDAVSSNPWRAMFVGFMLGLVFGRQSRPRLALMREGYVEPAMSRTQEALLGALLALAGAWRSTSMRTQDALDNARTYSKPLVKAARRATHRAKRKLHIGQTSFFWR